MSTMYKMSKMFKRIFRSILGDPNPENPEVKERKNVKCEEYAALQNKMTFLIDMAWRTQSSQLYKDAAETALKLKIYGLASHFFWKAEDMEKYEKYKDLYLSKKERCDKLMQEDPKDFGAYDLLMLGLPQRMPREE